MSQEQPPLPPSDDERVERRRRYKREHWQDYRRRKRRIQGTLATEEHAEIERRAQEANRSVWAQLHAEARAYARGEYLPSKDVEGLVTDLIIQLRRIGNNLNQVAREMHRTGDVKASELVEIVAGLESEIRAFVSRPWGEPADRSADEAATGDVPGPLSETPEA